MNALNNFGGLFALMFFTVSLLISCAETEGTTSEQKISAMFAKTKIDAPVCAKNPKELTTHGDTRVDNYYWLNDREDENVIQYLNDENTYREKVMEHLEGFQQTLYDEIVGRIEKTDMSVPFKDNGYFYLTRYEEENEYPIYARKKGNLEASEEVMLDVNVLAKDYSYYRVGARAVSVDNKLLAFGEDTLSRRIYSLRFKNLETDEYLSDKIEGTTGVAVWANDNKTVFYTKRDPETLRAYAVYKHRLGTDPAQDELVFEESDSTFYCYAYKTKSDKYIVISSGHTLTNEYRILNAEQPDGTFEIFEPRDLENEHEYGIAHYDDIWYVLTNWNAKNFRLMKTSVNSTGRNNWEEVIAHRDDVYLEDIEVFSNYIVLEERIKGITELRVIPNEGEEHYISFPEAAHLAYISTNMDFDTDVLRFGYQSMKTPNSTYDYDMRSKERTLLKQQRVLGEFNPEDYESERIYVKARDGVEVPVSLVYKKGHNKNAPCLLYGYGSYGSSMDPYFSSSRLSLLDRGFVYAIAHIRGGSELGKKWYDDGKLLNKKNTFYDFIDCGKHMIDAGYAAEGQLFAMGGSAGGLLMGAVINEAPELWKGIVAAVPFVDVVTTMLDETIPLTTFEYDEWGNPNEEKYYHYIKSYSPYDNVEQKDYPAMLVTTGLHDSQVQYWEPAKWVAKMRELKTDKNPLLMYCNMETGHGGASGRFERHKETAMEYAFMLDLAGLADIQM